MYVCTRRYTELHYQKKIIIKVGQYCIRQNETLSVYFHKAEHFTLKKRISHEDCSGARAASSAGTHCAWG